MDLGRNESLDFYRNLAKLTPYAEGWGGRCSPAIWERITDPLTNSLPAHSLPLEQNIFLFTEYCDTKKILHDINILDFKNKMSF